MNGTNELLAANEQRAVPGVYESTSAGGADTDANDNHGVAVQLPLPTQLQSYIHTSRYARWLDKENRRETWDETVGRYANFFEGRFPDSYPASRVAAAIRRLDVMPSMRSLMTAGEALNRDEMAGYNPVAGYERVVTREFGNVEIRSLAGKAATVLNKDGRWAAATFRSYGVQPLKRVGFKRNSNTVRTVDCTDNHRWILDNGTVKATRDLVKGDHVAFVSAPRTQIDGDYELGVRHGVVYGDGTATKSCGRVRGYHLRLCGDSSELLEWFADYPVCYPPSAGGDPVVMMYDDFAATHSLKTLPSDDETESYRLGFLRGWLAADGAVGKNGHVTLCCTGPGVEWLNRNTERLGIVVTRVYRQGDATNYGQRRQPSFIVSFSRSSVLPEDQLCSWKSGRITTIKSRFVVDYVEDLAAKEEVFCAEVPDTNTFVLEGGLLTGNCAAVAVDNVRAFDEILYVLMCGTGMGFSVERQFITKLPIVGTYADGGEVHTVDELKPIDYTIHVRDSKVGWATAFRELLTMLYRGHIPKWDISAVRPAGARLKVFGGRASGPRPLEDLFEFAVTMFKGAVGRKLNSLECHDLVCKIADIVVVGGVRRSALISLSNLSDERIRGAKSGQWWEDNPQRALANNSAAYTEKPDPLIFMKEWRSLIESRSGERGVLNRVAMKQQAAKNGRRDASYEFLTNPCAEIILRSAGLCNLTEVVIRAGDTLDMLKEKVEVATIMGTYQSTLTNFRYVRPVWRKNAEDERLLGVSMTGIMDHEVLSKVSDEAALWLRTLREHAIAVNKEWAAKLGINVSAAITTVKPSGTVSQLVDSASGIHPRYSQYYIRTVRGDKKDPLAQYMRSVGFPVEDDVMKPETTDVFSFPVKCPANAVMRNDMTAIEQLEHYVQFKNNWSEHMVSITVYVREEEWVRVGAWVYDHFDDVCGVSFLPHSDHSYRQAPYTECTEEEYNIALAKMPAITSWEGLRDFEKEDQGTGTREWACVSGSCEIL